MICDCEMKWYKAWWMSEYQSVDTDHIKDITCKDVDDGKEHLMKDGNLEHMYCTVSKPILILILWPPPQLWGAQQFF